MPKRAQYWTIEALDPFDASGCSTITLRLDCEHTDGLRMMNLDARYARIMLIPEVVRRPRIVLRGWRREGFEQGLIYVGRPERDYRSPTIETPPPKGMVFCVFSIIPLCIVSFSRKTVQPALAFCRCTSARR